jgi:hypothetical protein
MKRAPALAHLALGEALRCSRHDLEFRHRGLAQPLDLLNRSGGAEITSANEPNSPAASWQALHVALRDRAEEERSSSIS